MCILFMYNGCNDPKSEYSLILVSNRDEYYNRPTQAMGPWKEDPNVYGGRDLEYTEGGTWLAVSPARNKIGVLLLNLAGTNKQDAKSRGRIVADYLKSDIPLNMYIQSIRNYAMDCNDFVFVSIEFKKNLNVKCSTNLWSPGPIISSYTNVTEELKTYKDSYIGFGNSLPNKPLKKVEAGKNKLKQIVATYNKVSMQEELLDKLFDLLKSTERHLPDRELESKRPNMYKELSSIFVSIPVPEGSYGTRTHTIVLVTKTGHMKVIESTLDTEANLSWPIWGKTEYSFDMD